MTKPTFTPPETDLFAVKRLWCQTAETALIKAQLTALKDSHRCLRSLRLFVDYFNNDYTSRALVVIQELKKIYQAELRYREDNDLRNGNS